MPADSAHAVSRPGPVPAAAAADLAAQLEPLVRAAGMDLESVRIDVVGQRRLVRVVVDADGGVSLDDLAEASRAIGQHLDQSEAAPGGSYTLEVSSPGVDRPLTEPRHWRRASGRLVKVPMVAGKGSVSGRVVRAGDAGVTLEIGGATRHFTYNELGPGRIQVEFAKLDPAQGEASGH